MTFKPQPWVLMAVLGIFGGPAPGEAQPLPLQPPAADTNSAPAPDTGPRIEFVAPTFDFGRVESGKVVSHDFVFTNAGNQRLEITDIRSSCGCTAATNWSRQVEPGRGGVIPVLFNSGGMAGPVMKTLLLTCNDPAQPEVLLQFTASIWKPIDALPAIATFIFGPDFQTNETRVVRLVSNLQEPVTLSPPVCTNRAFKAELKTVREGKEFELRVTVVPPLGPGSLSAPITLQTSSAKMPVVSVTAFAMVQPALIVMPPRMALPPGPLEQTQTVTVRIQSNGTNFVTLSEPSINAKGVDVQLREIQPGRLFSLTATFPAGFRIPAGQTIEAQIKSSHPQSPTVKVPVFQPGSAAID